MGVSEYLPAVAAGCCAVAVAYVALSQASAAAGDDAPHEGGSSPSTSSRTASKSVQRDRQVPTQASKSDPAPHAAAEASSSSAGASSSSGSSDDNPGVCNHCKKAPEREEHLSRCSRCHHAWYCSKVRHTTVCKLALWWWWWGCIVGEARARGGWGGAIGREWVGAGWTRLALACHSSLQPACGCCSTLHVHTS